MGRSGPESQDSVVRSAATSDAQQFAFRAAVLGLVLWSAGGLLPRLALGLREGTALSDLTTSIAFPLVFSVFGAPAAFVSIGAAAVARGLRRHCAQAAWRACLSLLGVVGGCGIARLCTAVVLCRDLSDENMIVIGAALGAVWGVVTPSALFGAR